MWLGAEKVRTDFDSSDQVKLIGSSSQLIQYTARPITNLTLL